jgi:hypothetical protein
MTNIAGVFNISTDASSLIRDKLLGPLIYYPIDPENSHNFTIALYFPVCTSP